MIKAGASNIVGLIILMCLLAAMVSVAIVQVVKTVEDLVSCLGNSLPK